MIIDRSTNEEWINKGRKTIGERANETVTKLLSKYPGVTLDKDIIQDLTKIMKHEGLDLKMKLDV